MLEQRQEHVHVPLSQTSPPPPPPPPLCSLARLLVGMLSSGLKLPSAILSLRVAEQQQWIETEIKGCCHNYRHHTSSSYVYLIRSTSFAGSPQLCNLITFIHGSGIMCRIVSYYQNTHHHQSSNSSIFSADLNWKSPPGMHLDVMSLQWCTCPVGNTTLVQLWTNWPLETFI